MTQTKSGLSPQAIEQRMAEAKAALKRMKENPRVKKIVLSVPHDACQACRELAGTYEKEEVPEIPMDACSHPMGCRSFYQPFLDEIYP